MGNPDGFSFGGRHAETAALAHLLSLSGAIDARTGAPLSEAMILGAGGGIGLMYFVFEYQGEDRARLYVGPRNLTKSGTFQRNVCDRLGLHVKVQESASPAAAEKHLRAALAAGRPALVWGCRAALPGSPLPIEWRGMAAGQWSVFGWDGAADSALVADLPDRPLPIRAADVAAARAAIKSVRHRILTIDPPARPVDPSEALRAGLADCMTGMLAPDRGSFSGNFGLPALDKWAGLLTDAKDKRGWPRLFPPGPRLFGALTDVFLEVEILGGGGMLRGLFAECLEEAAPALGAASLAEVAGRYRDLAAAWTGFADQALPGAIPIFAEVKHLIRERDRAYREQAPDVAETIGRINDRLAALATEAGDSFPLSAEDARSHRADLRDGLAWILGGERRAIEDLAACLGLTSPLTAIA